MKYRHALVGCLCWILLGLPELLAQPVLPFPLPEKQYRTRLERSVLVPMADSVLLSTDIYHPRGAGDTLPAILVRTPYAMSEYDWMQVSVEKMFAEQGYVVIVQDVRGRYESNGTYTYMASEAEDSATMIDWIVSQPWSNGKVGTYGCSILGADQVQLAAQQHPHHSAAIPQGAGGAARYGGLIEGGTLELASAATWFRNNGSKIFNVPPLHVPRPHWRNTDLYPRMRHMPSADIWDKLPVQSLMQQVEAPPSDWEAIVTHPPGDSWWDQWDYVSTGTTVSTPALQITSWYDPTVRESFQLLDAMADGASGEAGQQQFLVVGPMTHCQSELVSEETIVGERAVGDARFNYPALYLAWYDYWLKGIDNGVLDQPRVQYYVMGANEWRTSDVWPLPETQPTPFYLHSRGRAGTRLDDGTLTTQVPRAEPADTYTYDPADPTPTRGGAMCCTRRNELPAGAFDQQVIEARPDVLVYSTEPLRQGVEVTGTVEAVLYVSSTAKDTDFTVKLVDVYPDGTAYNLTETILRARYREGYDQAVWMEDGEVYEIRLSLPPTSNYFAPGHQIRIEVSSSNFPRFDRNLNTGGKNFDESEGIPATNTLHHNTNYPSHVILPVIPAADQ